MIFHPSGSLPFTQYEYPVQGKADVALNRLARGFLKDTLVCINWLSMIPETRFPPEMIVEKTGTRFGMPELRAP